MLESRVALVSTAAGHVLDLEKGTGVCHLGPQLGRSSVVLSDLGGVLGHT